VQLKWFGHSTFAITGDKTVVIDPFDSARLPSDRFRYPTISGVQADLLLVTHEDPDHNGVAFVDGEPEVIRSTAGTFESVIGPVRGIVSEHDDVAGLHKGVNVIFSFELDGVRFCHLGDLGQRDLRAEQVTAIGDVDVLFVPVGGGNTLGGAAAAGVVRRLRPRLAVPMHYRTPSIDALGPIEPFLAEIGDVPRVSISASEAGLEELLADAAGCTLVLMRSPTADA